MARECTNKDAEGIIRERKTKGETNRESGASAIKAKNKKTLPIRTASAH